MPTADKPVRVGLAACLALAAVPVAAAEPEPEPGFGWMANHGQISAALVYGSTETAEDYSFAISCNNKRKLFHMTVYEDIAGAKAGEPLTIEIGVGAAKVAVEGTTDTDEMSGFVFGVAKKFAIKPVVAVLAGAGPAVIEMSKVTVTLPEKGRAEAVSEFAKACKLD
jgi:hypothetical protein